MNIDMIRGSFPDYNPVIDYEYNKIPELYEDEQGCWHAKVKYNAYRIINNSYKENSICKDKTIDVVLNGKGNSKALKKLNREIYRINQHFAQQISKYVRI